ncbi:hypothetical protein GF406_25630 [candidate division KSB1 bacterium]|nr:hypothetical protein [candidate division KSB1 bacterium]
MKKMIVILIFMMVFLSACSNDTPTDPQEIETAKLYYGYFMHGWQSTIPNQAIDLISSYTNTLFIDGDKPGVSKDIMQLSQKGAKAIVNLNSVFQNQLATDWNQEIAKLDTLWGSQKQHIAAICVLYRPFLSEHRVSATNWKFWTPDEVREAIAAVKSVFPTLPVMVVFAPDPQLPTRIPDNLDWVGLEYFAFSLAKEPTREEFFNGWTESGQGEVWGLNDYLTQFESNGRPIILVAQSFGDDIQYKFPDANSLQWYFDVSSDQDNIIGLLWWRAFDPFWDQTAKHGIYPYKVPPEKDMLIENLPNIIKLQREMGERIISPW